MNAIFQGAVVVVTLLAFSVGARAQTTSPLTRGEVKSRLIQIEQAGYNPATANPYDYPNNIQAAEACLAANQGAQNGKVGPFPCATQSAFPALRKD